MPDASRRENISADGAEQSGSFALCGRDALRDMRIHLLGVGGSGMSSLAAYLVEQGAVVTGSDATWSESVDRVQRIGVPIPIGHSSANLPANVDVVVVTAAARAPNPEIHEACRRRVPVVKYAQMLGLLMENYRGIAVSGTHGKTTTSAMITYILQRAGLEPSFIIGGNPAQLGGSAGLGGGAGYGEYLVAEACEYDRSFLNLIPEVAVITNIDRDHMDYFRDDEDLVSAFRSLAGSVMPSGLLVANADDPHAMDAVASVEVRKVTFGAASDADWRFLPSECGRSDGRVLFRPLCRGRELEQFELFVPGRHNVMNALAAAAVCGELGVPVETIREALAGYRGVERRLEHVGSARGVDVLDDYAHHPTEIVATLSAVREEYPANRLWCVFQPHQYSRTRLLMDGFAGAFGLASRVLVPDIHAARDVRADMIAVSSATLVARLCANGVQAEYVPTFDGIASFLEEEIIAGDVVLTMGAGPVNRVGRSLLRELRASETKVDLNANVVP